MQRRIPDRTKAFCSNESAVGGRLELLSMSETDKSTRSPIMLAPWARGISGAVGLLSAGLGGWSVFESSNQAGSTALLLLGAIFLLMALTGRVPDRIGKEGIEHDSIDEKTVKDALEFGSRVTQKEVAEIRNSNARDLREGTVRPVPTFATYHLSDNSRAQALARNISIEEKVAAAVEEVLPPGFTYERDRQLAASQSSSMIVDFVIRRSDPGSHAPRVGIEVLAGASGSKTQKVFAQLDELIREGELDSVIIVAAFDTGSELALIRSGGSEKVRIIGFDDNGLGEFPDTVADSLRNAVRNALQRRL